jgi:lipoyl(octanoyl) transferase
MSVETRWLGRLAYRDAWDLQHALARARAAGDIPDQLLLLEHPAVLTLGRHAGEGSVRAPADLLAAREIEVVRVERGGEVTYHGPGQLVGYPIVRLADRGLLIQPFVRLLESAMIETAARYGVVAGRLAGLPGVWCEPDGPRPRKLGALGLRVERGVTYHGIALNVTTDLADFSLIDPCGMPDVAVTSIAREARWDADRSMASTASVEEAARVFGPVFARLLVEAVVSEPASGDDRAAWHAATDGATGRAAAGGDDHAASRRPHVLREPGTGERRVALAGPLTPVAGSDRARSAPGG